MATRRRRARRKKEKLKRKIRFISTIVGALLIVGGCIYINSDKGLNKKISNKNNEELTKNSSNTKKNNNNNIDKGEIIITAGGDCTFGTDKKLRKSTNFNEVIDKYNEDYKKVMESINSITSKDDFTIINLEGVLTNKELKENKEFKNTYHFKGKSDYAKILYEGSIEAVNLENNHSFDYGEEGLNDTLEALSQNGIEYFNKDNKLIKDIKGIKFAFLGYNALNNSKGLKEAISRDIKEMKAEGVQIVISYFQWGIEGSYVQNESQKDIGRFAIDSGADMVLGSHPHVIQGIENYNGKPIVYSLGNLSFGGNANPKDKRSFMMQMKFNFEENKIIGREYKVIPILISSQEKINNYSPTIVEDKKKKEIIDYINKLSPTLKGKIETEFWSIES